MKKTAQNEPSIEIKKSSWDITKNILVSTCVFFTLFTMCLFTVHAIMGAVDKPRYVTPERFLALFPFALAISCADEILKVKTMSRIARTFIHYIITVLSFYLLLFLPMQSSANHFSVLAVISVIYWIIAAIILSVLASRAKKLAENAPYESVYAASKNYKGKKD